MAALTCDICGGKLTGKAGGVFECESCGMEYDTSWAKQKIQGIKGTVSIEGNVNVSGIATVDSLLVRAKEYYDSFDSNKAEEYYNRVLDLDPFNDIAREQLKKLSINVGAVYDGVIIRIIPIGCFVKLMPSGKEGMVHIRDLADVRVEKVENVVGVGDNIKVEVLGIDDNGRINLKRVVRCQGSSDEKQKIEKEEIQRRQAVELCIKSNSNGLPHIGTYNWPEERHTFPLNEHFNIERVNDEFIKYELLSVIHHGALMTFGHTFQFEVIFYEYFTSKPHSSWKLFKTSYSHIKKSFETTIRQLDEAITYSTEYISRTGGASHGYRICVQVSEASAQRFFEEYAKGLLFKDGLLEKHFTLLRDIVIKCEFIPELDHYVNPHFEVSECEVYLSTFSKQIFKNIGMENLSSPAERFGMALALAVVTKEMIERRGNCKVSFRFFRKYKNNHNRYGFPEDDAIRVEYRVEKDAPKTSAW